MPSRSRTSRANRETTDAQPPATTPEQVQQQKMMKWMSLLFPVFLYNGPSGLNLYILTSTTIGIIESKPENREMLDAQIPGFPKPSVHGHAGRLVLGQLEEADQSARQAYSLQRANGRAALG